MAKNSKSQLKEQQAEKASTPTVAKQTEANRNTNGKHMTEVHSILEYDEDLANAEAPVPLPAGTYPATIRGAEIKKAKNGDKSYVNVTFFIDADNYPPDYPEGDPDGTILSYGMGRLGADSTQRSRFNMKRFCQSIGASMGAKLDLSDWLGLSAMVEVVNEEYEGVNLAKISKVLAA